MTLARALAAEARNIQLKDMLAHPLDTAVGLVKGIVYVHEPLMAAGQDLSEVIASGKSPTSRLAHAAGFTSKMAGAVAATAGVLLIVSQAVPGLNLAAAAGTLLGVTLGGLLISTSAAQLEAELHIQAAADTTSVDEFKDETLKAASAETTIWVTAALLAASALGAKLWPKLKSALKEKSSNKNVIPEADASAVTEPDLRLALRDEIATQLRSSSMKYGVAFKDSPEMQYLVRELTNAGYAYKARQLKIAWEALQSPEAIADIVTDILLDARTVASEAAAFGVTPETYATLEMAAKSGAELSAIPKEAGVLPDAEKFYQEHVAPGQGFLDIGAGGAAMNVGGELYTHGAITHLIQDLVITRALKAAGEKITAFEFRQQLGAIDKKVGGIQLGDYIWRQLYDPINRVTKPINQPEFLFTFLKTKILPGLQ